MILSKLKGFFGGGVRKLRKVKIGPHEWISLDEWKTNLASNEGLYKKLKGFEKLVVGPHLTKGYDAIVGDADTLEDFVFLKNATDEQKNFFKQLWQANRHAAREYIFAIIGATEVWKKDIKTFQHTLSLLRTGEVMLKEEADEVQAIKVKEAMIKDLPDALQRHFPDLLGNLKKDYNELDDLLTDLELALRKFSDREAMIDDHLDRLKATHPFLFEG